MQLYLGLGALGVEGIDFSEAMPADYRPSQNAAEAVKFPWASMPDDLSQMSSGDRAIVESAWTGLMQGASSTLVDLLHIDSSRSLLNAGLFAPRRWMDFPFQRTSRLSAEDVSLEGVNVDLVFRDGESPARALFRASGLVESVSADIAYLSTRGAQQVSVTLGADPVSGGWTWFGYWSEAEKAGVLFALHPNGKMALGVPTVDGLRWTLCSATVDLTLRHTFTLYSDPAEDGPVVELHVDEALIAQSVGSRHLDRLSRVGVLSDTASWPMTSDEAEFGLGPATFVLLEEMSWTDTRLPPQVQFIPVLVDTPLQAESVQHSVHFTVPPSSNGVRRVDFRYRGLQRYRWAPDVSLESHLLQRLFCPLVDVPAITESIRDTEEARNLLIGLLFGLTAGPTPLGLTVALSALSGTPICLETGRVVSTVAPEGGLGLVVEGFWTQTRRVYRYGPHLRTRFAVGDRIERFELLTDGAEIEDWVSASSGSRFFSQVTWGDLEKFSVLVATVPANTPGTRAGDAAPTLETKAEAYLRKVLPLWMGVFRFTLELSASFREAPFLRDEVLWQATLRLRDALTNGNDFRYNDGHLYNTGVVYNAHLDSILQDRIGIEATNEDGVSPEIVNLFGESISLNPDESVTRMEP